MVFTFSKSGKEHGTRLHRKSPSHGRVLLTLFLVALGRAGSKGGVEALQAWNTNLGRCRLAVQEHDLIAALIACVFSFLQ